VPLTKILTLDALRARFSSRSERCFRGGQAKVAADVSAQSSGLHRALGFSHVEKRHAERQDQPSLAAPMVD
jgi:hypothetical protein